MPFLQGILALSLLGWVNALYTLIHRQGLFSRGIEEQSFCHVGQLFDCDAVAFSSYSSFAGMPVSALGMVYYSFVFVFALWTYFMFQDGKKDKISAGVFVIFALSVVALIPTAALAGLSFFAIKALCMMCLGTYVINVAIVILAAMSWKQNSGAVSFVSKIPQGIWIALAVLTALQLFSPKIIESSMNGSTLDSQTIQAYVARNLQASVKSFVTEGYPTLGNKDAPITIVEFSDLQCPHCKHAAMTLPPLVNSYGGKVKLVFKSYPLDAGCNAAPGVRTGMHPLACLAAKTGWCIFQNRGNEAFFKFIDEVFENQEKLTTEIVEQSGRKSGMLEAKLRECVNDFATHQAILAQTAEGTAAGVQGTPSIFVNGRLVETGHLPAVLKPILDSYLGR